MIIINQRIDLSSFVFNFTYKNKTEINKFHPLNG